MHLVIRALNGATVDWWCSDHDAVAEATFQVLDGAVCGHCVTSCTAVVATDGQRGISVEFAEARPPLHRKGVVFAAQRRHHIVRQAGSCGKEKERKMYDWVIHSLVRSLKKKKKAGVIYPSQKSGMLLCCCCMSNWKRSPQLCICVRSPVSLSRLLCWKSRKQHGRGYQSL